MMSPSHANDAGSKPQARRQGEACLKPEAAGAAAERFFSKNRTLTYWRMMSENCASRGSALAPKRAAKSCKGRAAARRRPIGTDRKQTPRAFGKLSGQQQRL